MNFKDFNLDSRLLSGLEAAGYTTCTDVQEQVLKTSQDGSDLYVQSQTGTGKTAAYLVAIIQEMLSKEENKGKKALILVPTRELAVQVEEEAKVLVGSSGLKAYSFYGGVGYEKQIAAIKRGVDIIVSTPGRLIDLQEGGHIVLDDVAFLVCDEADRMFDMGFYPELRKILKFIPKSENRQTMLFSATLNSYVKNLAWEYTRDPKEIEIACENITVSEIDQELLHVSSDDKMKLLIGILKNENPESVIIFCNTKRSCEVVAKRLAMNELNADFIIGDLPQNRRLKILKSFKGGTLKILVATDVAARGIDVNDLAMVINFDLPNEAENYVHRIGRTARAGKTGKAYTFCSEQDVYNLPAIERYIEMQIPAKVAYPELMLEDKSAGVYIKTENWHDDDNSSKGGYREKKPYRNSYKKDGKKSYKTSKPKVKKVEKSSDYDKMEEMSFDERMKFYKDKYSTPKNSYKKNGKKNSYNKNHSSFEKNNKNYQNKKNVDYKKVQRRPYNSEEKNKQPKKKGLFERIKAFFGR